MEGHEAGRASAAGVAATACRQKAGSSVSGRSLGRCAEGEMLTSIYSTDDGQRGRQARVERRNGKAVSLTVPAGGFVLYE